MAISMTSRPASPSPSKAARRVLRLSAAALLFAVAATSQAEKIPLNSTDLGLTIHAVVNGKPGTFLFDTGGGVSTISPQFAASIGCKPWGQITGFRMQGEKLNGQRCDDAAVSIGKSQVHAETLMVLDYSALLPPNSPHIDGSLSLDLFPDKTLRFSYSGRTLDILTRPNDIQALRGKTPMQVRVVRDAQGAALTIDLPVKTRQGTAWFEVDSGNSSGLVLVGKHLAGLFGLSPEAEKQDVSISLADGTTFKGASKVLDLILDGNLGTSFLEKNDIVIDIPGKRAWMLPKGQ